MSLWCFCLLCDFWPLLFCLRSSKSQPHQLMATTCAFIINGSRIDGGFGENRPRSQNSSNLWVFAELLKQLATNSSIFIPNVLISAFILQYELLMHENLFLVRCFCEFRCQMFVPFPCAEHLASTKTPKCHPLRPRVLNHERDRDIKTVFWAIKNWTATKLKIHFRSRKLCNESKTKELCDRKRTKKDHEKFYRFWLEKEEELGRVLNPNEANYDEKSWRSDHSHWPFRFSRSFASFFQFTLCIFKLFLPPRTSASRTHHQLSPDLAGNTNFSHTISDLN